MIDIKRNLDGNEVDLRDHEVDLMTHEVDLRQGVEKLKLNRGSQRWRIS